MRNTMQTAALESMAIGRVLAAQSHELKNVLAIIGEASGLMDDLLDLAQSKQPGAVPQDLAERLRKALGSVTTQVERGHRLTSDLNKLAHLPDRRLESSPPDVDLGTIAALACRMLARNAARAQVQLIPPPAVGQTVPADAQRCLAACIMLFEWLYQTGEAGTDICPEAVPGAAALDIPNRPTEETTPVPDDVRNMAAAAGLRIEQESDRLRVAFMGGSDD